MCWKATSAVQNPPMMYFGTKNGGFYNQLWENGCRIRTKNQQLQHEPPRRPDYAMFHSGML